MTLKKQWTQNYELKVIHPRQFGTTEHKHNWVSQCNKCVKTKEHECFLVALRLAERQSV